VEVLGPLTEPGDRVIRVRGNADRGMVEFLRTGHLATPGEIAGWPPGGCAPSTSPASAASPSRSPCRSPTTPRCCSATRHPGTTKRPSLVASRLDRWAEVHAGLDPAVGTVVRGHTHMPFARLAHGRLVVNPGGVGMPYGRPGAHWALLGSGVDA